MRERESADWPELSRRLAHRRFGVGCDQVLLIYPSKVADFRMAIYNADGSHVEMCGNGVRCFARYLREKGLSDAEEIPVETLAGVVVPRFRGDLIEVDMGEPAFEGRQIPVDADGPVRDHPLPLDDVSVKVTCLSMGNPHAVIFVADAESYPVEEVGPQVERHPFFPRKANVEFVQVLSRTEIRMRVWERGVGVTMACGTGASAAAAASHWTGQTERDVVLQLDGGPLDVHWDRETSHVFICGPATTVFDGEFHLEEPRG
jgi:diaminopimelate epimerase